jgi:hypothetical protein
MAAIALIERAPIFEPLRPVRFRSLRRVRALIFAICSEHNPTVS